MFIFSLCSVVLGLVSSTDGNFIAHVARGILQNIEEVFSFKTTQSKRITKQQLQTQVQSQE